ncbi:hypothetical protein [Aquabacterium sp.]|uniref:hypothetical protein n=1 Tax=Aquabacterium sp. TaxID=1872578 RepID=UPI002BCBAD34|nr:hypothetical protein [Aquabacterium sp.]HSW06159.1 hypothetical protein [Aquabacterium sp.]
MIIAIWIVALLLLGLWSLAGWGVHALLVAGVQWVGDLKPLLDRLPFAAIIEQWVPGWQDGLRLALDLMQAALGWLGGAAPLLVWLAWGTGTVLLLGLALLLTGVVVLVRKNSPPPPTASA